MQLKACFILHQLVRATYHFIEEEYRVLVTNMRKTICLKKASFRNREKRTELDVYIERGPKGYIYKRRPQTLD